MCKFYGCLEAVLNLVTVARVAPPADQISLLSEASFVGDDAVVRYTTVYSEQRDFSSKGVCSILPVM